MNNETQVWLNGRLVPEDQAVVPIMSHGFSRGSAVFEAFGLHTGPDRLYAFRMDEHLKRLENSIRALEMSMTWTRGDIIAALSETASANRIERGIAKIMVFWSEKAVINLVLNTPLDLAVYALPGSDELTFDQMRTGISACFSRWRKLHPETIPVEAKACANYLNGYLARKDANNRGFDVGVMIGTDGFLAEGSTESVFMVKDGVLKTPPLGRVLSSISRLSILEAAPVLGIPVSTDPISPAELLDADEIFTTHTGTKVHPVCRFEERGFQIPGPVTGRLTAFFEQVLQFNDDRFKHWYQPL